MIPLNRGAAAMAPTDIDRVVLLEDPVVRNLLITQRYHDLSLGLRSIVSGADVNWSTFATWASKTAGQSIRGEEVPPSIRAILEESTELLEGLTWLNRALALFSPRGDVKMSDLLTPVHRTLAEVSGSIAEGNLKVFRELAPEFAGFVTVFSGDLSYDETKLDAYLLHFRPGPVDENGQDLLRSAFNCYYKASFTIDPFEKAQLVYFANCQIGLHEQSRLQPEIAEALDAAVTELLLERLLDIARDVVPQSLQPEVAAALSKPMRILGDRIAEVWRRLATRFMMELSLPFGEELPLGEDLAPESGLPMFPPALARLSTPEQLLELWQKYDRPGMHTAARDWARIDDRMNYIINLFRSRQQDPALFGPPFSAGQIAFIEQGRIPPADLESGL